MIYYAIGDVHGCHHHLVQMLENIERDRKLREDSQIIFLGDYIDKGTESKAVLDLLFELREAPHIRFLVGNHDMMMSRILRMPAEEAAEESISQWMQEGGRETLISYNPDSERLRRADYLPSTSEIQEIVGDRHRTLIDSIAQPKNSHLFDTKDQALFAHAGIDPNKRLKDQTVDDFISARNEDFLFAPSPTWTDSYSIVVFGHTAYNTPQVMKPLDSFSPIRVGIDTGCYKSGCLTAAVIVEGQLERLITVRR